MIRPNRTVRSSAVKLMSSSTPEPQFDDLANRLRRLSLSEKNTEAEIINTII